MPRYFKPGIIVTPEKKKERGAITVVRNILGDEHVDYHLGENDKTADIDGYIALADAESCFEAKIEVQIKTLPKKYYIQPAFDCPTKLLGYAEISFVPVVLMVCDAKRKKVWCKLLNRDLIKAIKDKASQKTIKLYFDPSSEDLNQSNVSTFIKSWKKEYNLIYTKIDEYDEKAIEVKQLEELLSTYVNPELNLPRQEIKRIQDLIDRYNCLLDNDLLFVKEHNNPTLWKRGIAIFDYQSKSLVYSVFSIKYGENALLIKRIPYDSLRGISGIDTDVLCEQDHVVQYMLGNPIISNPSIVLTNLIKAECEKMLNSHDVLPEDVMFYTEYVRAFFSSRTPAYRCLDDIDAMITILNRGRYSTHCVNGIKITPQLVLHRLEWMKQKGIKKLPELYPERNKAYPNYYSYENAERKLRIVFNTVIKNFKTFVGKHFGRIKDKMVIFNGADYLKVFLNKQGGYLMAMAVMYKREHNAIVDSIVVEYEQGNPFDNKTPKISRNGVNYMCLGLRSLQARILVYQELNLISMFDLLLEEAFNNYFGRQLDVTPTEAIF